MKKVRSISICDIIALSSVFRKSYLYDFLIVSVLLISSCSSPHYLEPTVRYNTLINKTTFAVQNMDEKGKTELQSLTTHYDGFDIRYYLIGKDDVTISMEITNKTNKSIIIDKSKSYVLYNGYSRDLFKDVRSSRSTTFNNVQDAINNVQTSDASVIMTIPPYSKWSLGKIESNIKSSVIPDFINQKGSYSFQSYDNSEPVEFVIPYSFDYAMGKWDTSRNRIYIGKIDVVEEENTPNDSYTSVEENYYIIGKSYVKTSKEEIESLNQQNIKMWKSHRHKMNAATTFWGIITLPTIIGPILAMKSDDDCDEGCRPRIYNSDGTICGLYDKHDCYKSEY